MTLPLISMQAKLYIEFVYINTRTNTDGICFKVSDILAEEKGNKFVASNFVSAIPNMSF